MASEAAVLKRISLDIEGMTCNACVARLEKAFSRTAGIQDSSVNLPLEKATLVFDPKIIEFNELKAVVEKTGFDVGVQSRSYFVDGLIVAEDVATLEAALYNVPGVNGIDVNFAEERVQVSFISNTVTNELLKAAVGSAGYSLQIPSDSQIESREVARRDDREKLTLIVACLICVPFLIQMIAQFFGWEEIHMMPAAEVVLATPLQLIIGARFYRSAYNALRGLSANMDVLVVLGTSAAYLFSWYTMLQLGEAAEGELYFEASALILTFVLLGKRLESKAKHATTVAVRQLMDLRPKTVRIRNAQGEWEPRPTSELALGTLFEVRPGDRISADGIVRQGVTTVDEALITGESMPVSKSTGEMVFEGSINVEGRIEVETTSIGEDGTLQKIVRAIENAQSGKIAVQRLVDQVSAWFVPIVLCIAFLVFVSWIFYFGDLEQSLINAVSVLVIACPCALGLATPTAIVTGTGAAARAGVLFKDIGCIEQAQRTSLIAFDKTGTVTSAQPTLQRIDTLADFDANRVVQIAASIQSNSEHPIASAFVDAAKAQEIVLTEVQAFKNHIAEGVEGEIEGERFFVGNSKLVDRFFEGLKPTDAGDAVFLFTRDTTLARFEFSEAIRPNAIDAVTAIHELDIETLMLSGDAEEKTKSIAEQVGISAFRSRLTPQDKVAVIDESVREGNVVAMVGDGVNDAPALARASVGIAMGSGTDVSLEVASVTLMRNDLRLVSAAVAASRATFRKIKQNLFWAFIYNLIMLPLAALGFLTPTIAGAAMALSSVSVVCNSLLLRGWKPRYLD